LQSHVLLLLAVLMLLLAVLMVWGVRHVLLLLQVVVMMALVIAVVRAWCGRLLQEHVLLRSCTAAEALLAIKEVLLRVLSCCCCCCLSKVRATCGLN
jgi:hypothetical protein